jgi:ankyrin repeat protein
VHCSDAIGYTPLHHAVASGSMATVQPLLALGADPGARACNYRTPLDIAKAGGDGAMVQVLEQGMGEELVV